MSYWMLAPCGFGVMVVVMTLGWAWQKKNTNAGIVDVLWSFGTGGMCAAMAVGASGDFARRCTIAGLAAVWGVRLGVHLGRRVIGEAEDGRYQNLRAKFGAKANVNFFIFFQIQAAWTVMFATPIYFAAAARAPFPAWSDFAAAAVWFMAVGGEGLADLQLARFREDARNKGGVCNVGLWRYSRHPNYFFEWAHWFAYVLFGLSAPYWWGTLAGPVVMFLFLYKVTGIPYTEQRALKTRGDAYREYQRTTSPFFPWPPKSAKEAS
jgi:steroid 5-alpha reductase family enzyme